MNGNLQRYGKEERQNAKGRQVITLTLAITLRVTLVRDFVKSLFTLYIYIYIIFKMVFLYKTGYWVPFKLDYFRIKDCDTFCIHIHILYYPGWLWW